MTIHIDANGRPVLARRKRRIAVNDVVQYGDPRAMAYGVVTRIADRGTDGLRPRRLRDRVADDAGTTAQGAAPAGEMSL